MTENYHLYDKMSRLVKYYNFKLCEDDGALWELLVKLVNSDNVLSDRYAAVSLRNEYIRLSKIKQKRAEIFTEYGENHGATSPNIDLKLDIKSALARLSDKERGTVLMRYYWAFPLLKLPL